MGASSVREKAILYVGGKRVGGGAISGGNVLLNAGQHALDGPEHTGQLPAIRVSVEDAGAKWAATDVEGVLQEIPKVRVTTTDPTTGDDSGDGYSVGSRWINVTSAEEFVAADVTVGAAVWVSTTDAGSGAYPASPITIRYTFSTTTTDADPGAGLMRLSNATQYLAVTLRADLTDADGADVTALLDAIANWLSPTKGYVRIQHATDPTKWLAGTVSAIASPSGYRNITIANISKSANSPFADGDAVVVSFAPGTLAHAASHLAGGADLIKLDDLAAPDDNTDLDASTSAHGLMKKLPGGTTTFWRADGTFAAVSGGAGGGGLVFLEEHVASASATLDFTTTIGALYEEYLIELLGIVPATNAVNLWMRMSTDGGASYAAANYANDLFVWRAGGTGVTGGSGNNQMHLDFTGGGDAISTGVSQIPLSGYLRLFIPADTSHYKHIEGRVIYRDTAGFRVANDFRCAYEVTTAVDAFRFLMSSGNIASGTIRSYGIAK